MQYSCAKLDSKPWCHRCHFTATRWFIRACGHVKEAQQQQSNPKSQDQHTALWHTGAEALNRLLWIPFTHDQSLPEPPPIGRTDGQACGLNSRSNRQVWGCSIGRSSEQLYKQKDGQDPRHLGDKFCSNVVAAAISPWDSLVPQNRAKPAFKYS